MRDAEATPGDSRDPTAADVFESHLRRRKAGGATDFEVLCRAHPTLAAELRRFERAHRRLSSLLPGALSAAAEAPAAAGDDPRREPSPVPDPAAARFGELDYLAHGGLGVVYTAVDRAFERKVALKFLRSGLADNEALRGRFVAEARLTARMDHPGIAPVFGQGSGHDGRPYYAMQLVEGETLDRRILAHYQRFPLGTCSTEQSLDFRRMLQHLIVVCNTVAYAHGEGILHRDLKPANIVIGQFDRVRVLDWGLAKHLAGDGSAAARNGGDRESKAPLRPGYETVAGQPLGTIQFASPEQVAGHHDEVDARSDVYSLGAMFYCMLTGKAPFAGSPRSALRGRVLRGEFPAPRAVHSAVDPALEAVCLTAMARSPADRYPSAEALGDDLRRWLADEPVSTWREGLGRRLSRWRRRNRAFAWSIAAAATVALGGLAIAVAARREGTRREVVVHEAERRLHQAEASIARQDYADALVGLDAARAAVAPEDGLDSLAARIAAATDRARVHARVQDFERQCAAASADILGDYWARLPHEETRTQRRIANDAERAADLARGAARARAALELLHSCAGGDPFASMAAAGIASVQQIRRSAGELTFLLAIAVERLGQAEPQPAQEDRRREALALLAEAEVLGMRDRVVDLLRADMLARAGEHAIADALRQDAARRPPETFLDLHFAAVAHAEAQRWSEAVSCYQAAMGLRSGDYWALFRMAKALENDRRLDQAESVYRTCLAVRPQDATAQNNLGCLMLAQRRWETAAREFEEVIANHPDYLMAYTNLMLAHAERGDVASTERVQERLLARPHDAFVASSAWNHLGLAHERAGQDPEAAAAFTRAIAADPRAPGNLRNRALARQRLGDFAAAETDIDAALRLAPADADLHFVKGNVYACSDRPEPAVLAYGEALRLDPALVRARHNRALQLSRLGRLEEAIADHRAVLERQPDHGTARWDIAVCYARIGQRDRDPDRLRVALGIVAEFLEKQPRHAAALVFAGKLHGDLGAYVDGRGADADLAASERLLGRALEVEPANVVALRARGVTRLKAHDWRGTIADWQDYLRLSPQAPDGAGIRSDLSIAHLELGEIDTAIALLQEAIQEAPDPAFYTNLGNVHLRQGDLEQARAAFDRALALDATHTFAWALRGQAALRQGRFADAADDLRHALGLEPGVHETLVLAGTALLRCGDEAAARRLLEQVGQDRPDQARGRYALGCLRLLDGDGVQAVPLLSHALRDPALGRFALAARAQAWLLVGGAGLAAAVEDAETLCATCPDALARAEAAAVVARAAAHAAPADAKRWRARAAILSSVSIHEGAALAMTRTAYRGRDRNHEHR